MVRLPTIDPGLPGPSLEARMAAARSRTRAACLAYDAAVAACTEAYNAATTRARAILAGSVNRIQHSDLAACGQKGL